MLLPLLLLPLAVQAQQQLPFRAPPALVTLTLQSAIHLHTNRTLPPLHKGYSPAVLSTLDAEHSEAQQIRTARGTAYRPSSDAAYQAARRASYYTPRALRSGRMLTPGELSDTLVGGSLEWTEHDIELPDVSDVVTIASLAKMTANAYTLPDNEQGWYDLDGRWNVVSLFFYHPLCNTHDGIQSDSFGWLEDGLRGHVFADPTNSTVVIAIKGTSAGLVGGSGTTGKNDKVNVRRPLLAERC